MVAHSQKTTYEAAGVPDLALAALAHPVRRDIVRRTLAADKTVSALATRYDMSFAAVRKHVVALERASLVSKTRRGREQIVRADPETLAAVRETLEHLESFGEDRLDRVGP